jgi:hypothetical protein
MTVCGPQGTALIDQALAAEAHMVRPILVSSATKICPGRPGRLSAIRVFLCRSVLYGTFVWARRVLNRQKRRFPARAVVFFAFKEVFGETTPALRFRRLSSWSRCFSGRFPCLKDDR